VIDKADTTVFDYVKILKNQEYYNVWPMKDLSATKERIGTDGTVGYIVKWDSKNDEVGKGEQEITSLQEGKRLDMTLRFYRPFESTGTAYMTTEATGPNQTKLTWAFEGNSKYPMNIMNLMMDGMLGKDMNTSLGNLKKILEK
jgi:hypothetical protein